MQITIKQAIQPPTDVERVLEEEIHPNFAHEYHPENGTFGWHQFGLIAISLIPSFIILDIYFLQRNAAQHAAALALRDAILRLRRDGAFVAVPLYRVNTAPVGPHPAELGYSRIITGPTIEERKVAGRKIEETLRGDREAAPAPTEG
ncbi:hypothetical protein RhiTH_000143 [Rhizoctonia solani]